MCKHLVRLANIALSEAGIETDLSFFLQLRRQHTAPFYHFPGIHDALLSTAPVATSSRLNIGNPISGASKMSPDSVGNDAGSDRDLIEGAIMDGIGRVCLVFSTILHLYCVPQYLYQS